MGMDAPQLLRIHSDGRLDGATRVYRKRLGEMRGVYRDGGAFERQLESKGEDHVVYEVHEQKYDSRDGSLTVGTSALRPGRYGDEFAMTKGHLHGIANRAELYHCLSGHGLMLLETTEGDSSGYELRPGDAINVPGDWIHRSVNLGDEPFVTLFCYNSDAGQNYDLIEEAAGMSSLVVAEHGGWALRSNPDHRGYAGAERA